jgi:hypothetical protein
VNFGRALTYAFQDKEWAQKLLMVAVASFVGVILSPVLIGLAAWALVLGYHADVIRGLRASQPRPLPRWDRLGERMAAGGSILTAVIVYNLPNLLPLCCLLGTSLLFNNRFLGDTFNLVLLCCLTPLLIAYNVVTWPMIALGTARYAEERNIGVYFQFTDLLVTLWGRLDITVQWMLATFFTSVVLGFIFAIPCVGWAAAPALWVPVQAYFTARLAMLVDEGGRAPRSAR